MVGVLLKQVCEKIDRVRDTAGTILARVVDNERLDFVHKEFLKTLIDDAIQR